MAIFHLSGSVVSRSGGRSIVSIGAYNAGDRLVDHETGKTIDKTHKKEVVHSEISLCENAPIEYADREVLWNAVEKKESYKDAQLARSFIIALPREITDRKEQIQMVRSYIDRTFVNGKTPATSGQIVDWSIHDKGDGNPHVHMLVTMRAIKEDGSWADHKKKSVYKLDSEGNKIPKIEPATGEQAVRIRKGHGVEKLWEREYVSATPWSSPKMMEIWRSGWADICNDYLKKIDADPVDHRSYARQGIDRIPTLHEGYYARKMETEGKISAVCQQNRLIKAENYYLEKIGDKIENKNLVRTIIDKIQAIGTTITSVPKIILAVSKDIFSEILKFDLLEKIKGVSVEREKIPEGNLETADAFLKDFENTKNDFEAEEAYDVVSTDIDKDIDSIDRWRDRDSVD